MKLNAKMLDEICGNTRYKKRKSALVAFLDGRGYSISRLAEPHIMAQFLAQVLHESGRMRYVKEVWGPTAAQRRYEGRKDLGNVRSGDGRRFSGLGLIQVTGRYNFRHLTAWVRAVLGANVDFEATPQELAKPEWLGAGALWYWTERVPDKYIDSGDVEMVSRRVNGGRNGLDDRLDLYTRAGLVLLGYGATDIHAFQQRAGITADGIDGPATRGAIHLALYARKATAKPPRAGTGVVGIIAAIIAALFGGQK